MRVFEVFWVFLKLGCTSFGGPIAHLGYFREAFVNKYQWLSEKQYAYLVGVSQIIPGPASSQVGFGIGLHRAGLLGGLAAFIGFTLPSVVLLLIFASHALSFDNSIIQKIVGGLTLVAFVVVFHAVVGMSKQLLVEKQHWLISIVVALIVLVTESIWLQALCIVFAALGNLLVAQLLKKYSARSKSSEYLLVNKRVGTISLILFVLVFVGLPFAGKPMLEQASNYYISGSLVFGGGHVVLPFLESVTVSKGLLSEEVFFSGYGFTQALPGPMFSFAAYLGYMAELNQGGTTISALLSSLNALFFVFLPGFLLMLVALSFLGNKLQNRNFNTALDGANAAVVGVLAATLYDPIFIHAIDSVFSVIVAIVGIIALLKFRLPILVIITVMVMANVIFT